MCFFQEDKVYSELFLLVKAKNVIQKTHINWGNINYHYILIKHVLCKSSPGEREKN